MSEQDWYFTWGFGHDYENCYTIIHGTRETARVEMVRKFGNRWAFQYPSAEAAGVKEYNLMLIPFED